MFGGGGLAHMYCERVGCGCLVWLRLLTATACLFVGMGCSFSLGLGKAPQKRYVTWCLMTLFFESRLLCS